MRKIEYKHSDFLGNELNIGDDVIWSNYWGDLYDGKVTKFTKRFIGVTPYTNDGDLWSSYILKHPYKVYKINETIQP